MFFELRFRSIAKFVCSFNNGVRYVIDSGKKGKYKGIARKWKGKAKKMQRTRRGKGEKRERRNEEMKNKSMKK